MHMPQRLGAASLAFAIASVMGLGMNSHAGVAATLAADTYTFSGGWAVATGDLCGPAICWSNGNGTYQADTTSCTYSSEDGVANVVPETGSCSGVSTGSFMSAICGIGKLKGTATIEATSGDDAGEGDTTFDYEVEVVGGTTVFTGTGIGPNSTPVNVVGSFTLTSPAPTPIDLNAPGDGPCLTAGLITGWLTVTPQLI
jgi:hypothetical protein